MNMNNNYLENAVNELKEAGIIKTNYSTNRIKLYESRKNFHIGNKEFYYMDCRFYRNVPRKILCFSKVI